MQPARIAELLAPFLGHAGDQLTSADLNLISTYIDLLLHWNARINLTAIRDPGEIVTRHFGESFFAARILFPNRTHRAAGASPAVADPETLTPERNSAASSQALGPQPGIAALQGRVKGENESGALVPTLADVGSGAGFPGAPAKLWAPYLSLTLIESNQKKATFLRELARALTLTDINIQTNRADTLPEKVFNVVTLRAVERFESALLAAARLVAPGGQLALLIGSAQLALAHSLLASMPSDLSPSKTTPFSWSGPIPIPNSRSRILVIAHHASRE